MSIADDLINDLNAYLGYLKERCGYRITLHHIEGASGRNWPLLLPYNYHDCAVCREIKSSGMAWQHCISRQSKVEQKAHDGPYIGTCYAGVTEAVFPLDDVHGRSVGFLCVSGYTQDLTESRERAAAAAQKYGLSRQRLLDAADCLDGRLPDLRELSAVIAPVQTMLRMLFYFSGNDVGERVYGSGREKLYDQILKFANAGFRSPGFSLRDVCARFSISYSYASHLFAQFNELSFARYIRSLRIEAAMRYLEHTSLSITITASECGFSDSDYFSSVFREETGMTPTEYRKRHFRPR